MAFNSLKFIVIVRDKSLLWDREHKDYNNLKVRKKCWLEIGELVYEDWSQLTMVQKNQRVKEMKQKWRNIRDTYMKSIYRPAREKEYIYASALKFLNIYKKSEKRQPLATTGRYKQDNVDKGHTISRVRIIKRRKYKEGPAARNFGSLKVEADVGNPKILAKDEGQSKSNGGESGQERLDGEEKGNEERKEEEGGQNEREKQDEDPDKFFLISLLSDLKKLNDDEKLDFKLMMLKYFQSRRNKNTSPAQLPDTSDQTCLSHENQDAPDYFQKPYFQMQLCYPAEAPPFTSSSTQRPLTSVSSEASFTPPLVSVPSSFISQYPLTSDSKKEVQDYIQTNFPHQFE